MNTKSVRQVRGRWIPRITVPEALREKIGQRELVARGLPPDSRSRERLAHGIINRILARIDAAREFHELRKNAPKPVLSIAAKAHYANTLGADDQQRAAMPTKAAMEAEHERILQRLEKGEIGTSHGPSAMFTATTDHELMLIARDSCVNTRSRRLAALRASFTSGVTRWIEPAVRQYITENKLDMTPDSHEWHDLAHALTRAEIAALEHSLLRDRGDFGGQPRDPLPAAPDPAPKEIAAGFGTATGMTLSEALGAFHKEQTAGDSTLAPKTMEEYRNAARVFNGFMGGEIVIRSISKKKIVDHKQALLETPNRYTMRLRGLALPQAIRANTKRPQPFSTLIQRNAGRFSRYRLPSSATFRKPRHRDDGRGNRQIGRMLNAHGERHVPDGSVTPNPIR